MSGFYPQGILILMAAEISSQFKLEYYIYIANWLKYTSQGLLNNYEHNVLVRLFVSVLLIDKPRNVYFM